MRALIHLIYIFLFFFYSFLGWALETLYRSFKNHRPINAGFLKGPFTPIYGIGSILIIILNQYINYLNPSIQVIIYFFTTSLVEYAIGFINIKLFGIRLWDYSEKKINIHGLVCLEFSLIWTALAIIFIKFIHPIFYYFTLQLPYNVLKWMDIYFIVYITFDLSYSIIFVSGMLNRLNIQKLKFLNLSDAEINDLFNRFKRIFYAFPYLRNIVSKNLKAELSYKLNGFFENLKENMIKINKRKKTDMEYHSIINDILDNKNFQRLKEFQHHDASIYEHVLAVSYLAYKICKQLNLDYRAAARGGLLHDFFLYNWRDHDYPDLHKNKFHGFAHPKIALDNSEKEFKLTEKEKDIIIKHMWPLTIIPPKYKESFVVTFADKYVSSKEFFNKIKLYLKNTI